MAKSPSKVNMLSWPSDRRKMTNVLKPIRPFGAVELITSASPMDRRRLSILTALTFVSALAIWSSVFSEKSPKALAALSCDSNRRPMWRCLQVNCLSNLIYSNDVSSLKTA